MLPGKQYSPMDYAAMAWRRRWVIVVSLLLGAYGGLVVSSRMPAMYQSEMLIQVVPQRVPDAYVKSTVTMKTVDRLSALYEQITSRTELERLITELNLYPGEREALPMQDVVERMRLQVNVAPSRAGANQDADSFYVRFSYTDPETAKQVTERLGGLFIDVNARDRDSLAQATNSFLQTQLEESKQHLEETEERLKRFRERNAGRLPTQAQYNLQALQAAQMRAQALVENLARDRDQKLTLEGMYASAQAEVVMQPPPQTQPQPPQQPAQSQQPTPALDGNTAQQLGTARQMLVALEFRLTPDHPDVIRTKNLIAKLDTQLADEVKAAEAARAAESGATTEPRRPAPAPVGVTPQEAARRERLEQQRAQIESLERQILFREEEERRVRSSIDDLQRRIEQTPGVESEWIGLSRDYDTQQNAYKDLLIKSEAAKLAANLEQRKIGEQFRILDPARTPFRPVGVDRLEINAVGAAIGLALGLMLTALLELRDQTFRSSADVVEVLRLPVIALVPQVISTVDRQRRRVRRLMVSTAVFVLVTASAYGFWTMQLWKYVV